MPAVRKMYLSDNAFTYVPEMIFGMPGLEELDVSGNRIERFPADIAQMAKLKTLFMGDNPYAYPNHREYVKFVESIKSQGVEVFD